jgi:hypothetical protein
VSGIYFHLNQVGVVTVVGEIWARDYDGNSFAVRCNLRIGNSDDLIQLRDAEFLRHRSGRAENRNERKCKCHPGSPNSHRSLLRADDWSEAPTERPNQGYLYTEGVLHRTENSRSFVGGSSLIDGTRVYDF